MLVHLEKLHVCKIGAGGGGGVISFFITQLAPLHSNITCFTQPKI